MLFLPPIACALLVLYCRQHNYIACVLCYTHPTLPCSHLTFRDKLLEINERRRWVHPNDNHAWNKLTEEQKMTQDDQIFNTARLINCGHFASAVFGDYLHSLVPSCLL